MDNFNHAYSESHQQTYQHAHNQQSHQPVYQQSPNTNEPNKPPRTAQHQTIDENLSPNGKFFSLKVHGNKAAIEVKYDRTRKGFYTIRLEAAPILPSKGQGHNVYNWGSRITLQLTKTDLVKFLKVSLLIIPKASFSHYGENNDKSAELSYQGNQNSKRLFAQLTQKGKPMLGVPISLEDLMLIGNMSLNQYLKNFPNISADAVIRTLERQSAV